MLSASVGDEVWSREDNWWQQATAVQQSRVDAAIAKHADTETLYDRPYEDNKVVRVTGPFTVESLSPHRTISVEEKKDLAQKRSEDGFTVTMMARACSSL